MIIKTNSKKLLSALQLCKGALSTRPIDPVCAYYHIKGAGSLLIEACNMEVSISTTVTAETDGEIDILLPGEKITAILSKLTDQGITLEISNDYQIALSYQSGKCEFAGLSGADFPAIQTEKGNSFIIPADDLQAAIYTTAYARGSVDDALIFISGLNVEFSKSGIDMVASNRYVLSKSHIDGKFKDARILMPVNIVNIIAGLKLSGDVSVDVSDSSISFITDDIAVKSRLMGERFPVWQTMVPKCEIETSCNRADLLSAVTRVMDFSNKTTNKLTVTCGAELVLTTTDLDFKQHAKEAVSCDASEFEIGINGNLFAEALNHMACENVRLRFKDYRTALVIQDQDNLNDVALVMAIV